MSPGSITVHAKIITWRLSPELQSDAAFDAFLIELADRNVTALRKFGLLDGFVVRTAPDMMMTINFYESAEHAEEAFNAATGRPEYGESLHIAFVSRQDGAAFDLPLFLKSGLLPVG